jgi:hypothetical protein
LARELTRLLARLGARLAGDGFGGALARELGTILKKVLITPPPHIAGGGAGGRQNEAFVVLEKLVNLLSSWL